MKDFNEVSAYPLSWPASHPRTKNPEKSRFKTSFINSRDSLFSELKLMGGYSRYLIF